jgi:hypothetical protein
MPLLDMADAFTLSRQMTRRWPNGSRDSASDDGDLAELARGASRAAAVKNLIEA